MELPESFRSNVTPSPENGILFSFKTANASRKFIEHRAIPDKNLILKTHLSLYSVFLSTERTHFLYLFLFA